MNAYGQDGSIQSQRECVRSSLRIRLVFSFFFLVHKEKFSVMIEEYNHPNLHNFLLFMELQHSLLTLPAQQFLNGN